MFGSHVGNLFGIQIQVANLTIRKRQPSSARHTRHRRTWVIGDAPDPNIYMISGGQIAIMHPATEQIVIRQIADLK